MTPAICPECGGEIKEGRLQFGGADSDCDFDDEDARGPWVQVCGCGVRFALPEPEHKKERRDDG